MNVFIFGSNLQGFHGAGTAGFAMRGESANTWRTCPIVAQAMREGTGYRGVLAVWGCAEGFQQGARGASYAIPTVTRPGARRSISLDDISRSVRRLLEFMLDNPEHTFCLTPFGCGYAGYTRDEMQPLYDHILREPNARWATTVPANIQNYHVNPPDDLT